MSPSGSSLGSGWNFLSLLLLPIGGRDWLAPAGWRPCVLRRRQRKRAATASAMTARPTPMPIPACAPVDRPLVPSGLLLVEAVASAPAVVEAVAAVASVLEGS